MCNEIIRRFTPGFNLASYAKRNVHQAIHMGGALQLLFGIKGKRGGRWYSRI